MKKKLLKTSLFGFSKAEVCAYIARLNDEFNDRISQLTAEHKKEKSDLLEQIAALNEEMDQYKQADRDVAQVLFSAQQHATQLREKVDEEYKAATDEFLGFKQAETEKLTTYRDRVEKVRKDIVDLLADLDGKLLERVEKTEELIAEYNSEEGISL